VEGVKEVLEEVSQDHEDAVVRDKEIYHFNESVRKVFPLVIPEDFNSTEPARKEAVEQNRETQEKFLFQNQGVTKNTVDPEDQENERIEKANITPPGGMTPGGYKKIPDGKGGYNYVKPEDEKSGGEAVQSFAIFHGGKVTAHKDDPDVKVLKLPKDKAYKLKNLREQQGIAANVIIGGKYSMLFITKEELAKLKELAPKKKKPSKKKKSQAPTVEPVIPVDGSTVKRQGEFKILHESDLEPPSVHGQLLQRGHKVAVLHKGETVEGTLAGYHYDGRPSVHIEGVGRKVVSWKKLKPVEAPGEYRPSYHGLPDDALVVPSEKQKKLVQKVMKMKVVGKHDANEYVDWLRDKGQEVYLVGGIVRDLLAGTKPDSTMTDAEIIETMKDVDIVTTAHPEMARKMMKGVSSDVVGNGVTNDCLEWGVLRSVGHGLGLDFSSMATQDGIHTQEVNWDHDIEGDTSRRDFTCNSLYYDTHNDVIIDPLGTGIADAQNKVLRLAPSPKEAMLNNSLHIRFWKFRIKGYVPEKETLEHMKKQAAYWWSKYESKPNHIVESMYKAVGKSGVPEKNLKAFRDAMYADGAGHLYEKYLKPLEKKIIEYAKVKGPE